MHDQEDLWSTFESSGAPERLSWSQERRLKFIDFRLRWEGRINRTDLVEFFAISMPQASADLARYLDAAPFNLEYDRSTKAYLRTPAFRPLYERSASRMYLAELQALVSGMTEPEGSFIKWRPPVATLPLMGRQVEGEVLTVLLAAIREGRMVNVEYHSVTRPSATYRVLSPHALAHDGSRWHVRAFCHARKQFLDFVIARIRKAELGAPSSIRTAEDQEWHTEVTLRVAPHPGLPDPNRRALELDYAMADGVLEVRCKHAMLLYALLSYGLLSEGSNPLAQPLVLLNRAELQPYLDMLVDRLLEPPEAGRLI